MGHVLAASLVAFAGTAAGPRVQYSVPFVVPTGAKAKVVLRGLRLDAVKEVRASDPAAKVKVLAARKAKPKDNDPAERLGDTEVEVEVEVPKGTRPGSLTLSAVGPAGRSAPFAPLLPDPDHPASKEKEPNDGFAQAQPLTLPATLDGVIGRERDVDVYAVTGKAGEALRVEVHAARHGSPLDAALTVHDAAGRLLGAADDAAGTSDPALTVTLPKDGTYYVTVSDANDLGGGAFGYRLVVKSAAGPR